MSIATHAARSAKLREERHGFSCSAAAGVGIKPPLMPLLRSLAENPSWSLL
jgi:hypothetical protein